MSENKNECLVCGKPFSQLRRGLCMRDYTRFAKEVEGMTSDQQHAYENALIDRGLLAERKRPGRQVEDNPFADIASEIRSRQPEQPQPDESEEVSKEIGREAKRAAVRSKVQGKKSAKRKRGAS